MLVEKKWKKMEKNYRCNRIFDRNSDRYSFFDFSPQIKVWGDSDLEEENNFEDDI